jgi:zinc/manganese transport system substrate-binding protein
VSITEPVPLYLLAAMGLKNRTPDDFSRAVEESGDVSPRVLADTLALYSDHRVAALIYNSQTSGPITAQVEAAARSAGVPVVPVTETLPAGTSYLTWMSRTIARVAAAVTGR